MFVCFASLAGGIALVLRSKQESGQFEDRLASMTANRGRGGKTEPQASVLAQPLLENAPGALEEFFNERMNLSRFIYQAGVQNLTVPKFLGICTGLGTVSTMLYLIAAPMKTMAPLIFICMFFLPFVWLLMKRNRRMRVFSSQLADAMDVLSRALRSGYSLPAGLQLIGNQDVGTAGSRVWKML